MGAGRSGSRLEGRLGNRVSTSPRKRPTKVADLREKLKRTSKDQVEIVKKPRKEMETDPTVLARREKELQYGKTTENYLKYRELMPKEQRLDWMPRTPNKYEKCSRRKWDGQVKNWKVRFHKFVVSGGQREGMGEKVPETTEVAEGRLERWEEKLRREEEELDRAERELEREEAELMLQEENAGPRSRVTSQSSNSSWVDIMDEEDRQETLERSLSKLRRSRPSSVGSDLGMSVTTSGTATPRTLSGSVTPDLHKDLPRYDGEDELATEDGEIDYIET